MLRYDMRMLSMFVRVLYAVVFSVLLVGGGLFVYGWFIDQHSGEQPTTPARASDEVPGAPMALPPTPTDPTTTTESVYTRPESEAVPQEHERAAPDTAPASQPEPEPAPPLTPDREVPPPQNDLEATPMLRAPLYDTQALSFGAVNARVQPALVNILCGSSGQGGIPGSTGSGVIIDPRGVILTNAHVAQYMLLQQHPDLRISCTIRTGAPAKNRYTADVLAFPEAWADAHVQDIQLEMPTGTGENDWALLYITGTTNGTPKPDVFPFVPFDTREAIARPNDPLLVAGYPAGFLGGATLQRNLFPASSVIAVQKVFTFESSLIDVLSLGGSVVAQGGSSGGAVVNAWGQLVGLIVTSSLGETTNERDLRALTLAHIDRSVTAHTGLSLHAFLQQGNFAQTAQRFRENVAPALLELFPL